MICLQSWLLNKDLKVREQARPPFLSLEVFILNLTKSTESCITRAEWVQCRIVNDVRGVTRKEECNSCWTLLAILRTLAFILSEVENNWNILNGRMVWSDLYINKLRLTILWRRSRETSYDAITMSQARFGCLDVKKTRE